MYDGNEVVNGLYGAVYNENGEKLQSTQEFETNVEYNKEEVPIPGQFMVSHKVMNGVGTGSMMFHKLDSRLQRQIAENPHGKYNYIGKLNDPTSRGEEAILYTGVSFDAAPLMSWSMNEMVEVEVEFTFDNFRYTAWID